MICEINETLVAYPILTNIRHGSWDSPADDIGSYVFAHTNLTEIEAALDLLWRNSIPASQVNLGIGFYGRWAFLLGRVSVQVLVKEFNKLKYAI